MASTNKRLISLNLAFLLLFGLALPAFAAEPAQPTPFADLQAAETASDAVQAEFIDESGNVLQTVDASADGWLAPLLPDAGSGNPFLYWFAWDENNGFRCCVPGVRYPKLTATTRFSPSRASGTRGILYCDGNLLHWAQNSVWTQAPMDIDAGCLHVSQSPAPKDGRRFFGWTLTPDGRAPYFAYGDTVPGTDVGWVTLYGQWLSEGMAAIYIQSHPELCAPQGSTITLPDASREGYRLSSWSGYNYAHADQAGAPLTVQKSMDGWQLTVPEDAEQIYLDPLYYPTSPITIDGSAYLPTETENQFSGNGWSLYYRTDGWLSLSLHSYHGGAIDLPVEHVSINLYGSNQITGSEISPALRCTGNITMSQTCEYGKHSDLTITAGETQHAVSSKQLQLAPHTKMIGGKNFAAVAPSVEIYVSSPADLVGGPDADTTASLTPSQATTVHYLEAQPIYKTVVIHGNGGQTASGQNDVTIQQECGEWLDLSSFGFSCPRHILTGYIGPYAKHFDLNLPPPPADYTTVEYTLQWQDTGFDHYIAFDTLEPIVGGTENQKSFLFQDNSATVIAPSVTFVDNTFYSELLYWSTSNDVYAEAQNSRQYLPGETVKEPDGTMLYACRVNPQYWLVLDANGKRFNNGLKYTVRQSCSWDVASDGTQLLSWNTEPDGSGDRYEIGAIPDLQGRKTVLTLYAQWLPADSVLVSIETQAGIAQSHASAEDQIQLPYPSPEAGYAFDRWSIWCTLQDRSVKLESSEVDGIQYVQIPDGAVSLYCTAYYYPTAAFIIDGTEYRFTSCEERFTGDGWTLAYDTCDVVVLVLDGYHGSEIVLPAHWVIMQTNSDSTVTANADASAVSCTGRLTLYNSCTGTKHPQLAMTGADGFAAISAAKLELCCPHLTLIGGNDANAVSTKQFSTDYHCTLVGGTDASSIRPISTAQAQSVHYLEAKPIYSTITFDGNGGTTANGKTTISAQYENGTSTEPLNRLFRKPGAQYVGYYSDGLFQYNSYNIYVQNSRTASMLWTDTGFDNFLSFHVDGPIQEPLDYTFRDPLLDYTCHMEGGWKFYDNSKAVLAPTITYIGRTSAENLLYWYVSDSWEEASDAHQYLPGEIVTEENGTSLYPRAISHDQMALFSNGKTFLGGKKAILETTCLGLTASDGTQLLSWNTEPDGSGDRCEIGDIPALADRTAPLILYAQWKPAAYTASLEQTTTGSTLTITPSAGSTSAAQPISPEQTVYVAAYRDGQMRTVMQGRVIGEQICCSVSDRRILQDCVLKLYVLNGNSAPDRQYEFVSLSYQP